MSETRKEYWASPYGEIFNDGPFPNREEAIEEMRAGGHDSCVTGVRVDLHLCDILPEIGDGVQDQIYERLGEAASEWQTPDGFMEKVIGFVKATWPEKLKCFEVVELQTHELTPEPKPRARIVR